jgi:hypothetical protein
MRSFLALVFAAAATSAAADVGIGVSAKTDSATIYIPITVGRFMIEPYVRATDRESESLATTGTILALTTASASQFEATDIGVGIFRVVPLAERMSLYYGGRLARIDQEAQSFTAFGVNTVPAFGQPAETNSAEGHSIIPALGFQYNIVERFSIGAEIGVNRSDVETETVDRSQSGAITSKVSSDITTTDTRADVIFRFFF